MRYPKRKLALFFAAQTLAIAVMGFLPRANHAWNCPPFETCARPSATSVICRGAVDSRRARDHRGRIAGGHARLAIAAGVRRRLPGGRVHLRARDGPPLAGLRLGHPRPLARRDRPDSSGDGGGRGGLRPVRAPAPSRPQPPRGPAVFGQCGRSIERLRSVRESPSNDRRPAAARDRRRRVHAAVLGARTRCCTRSDSR